MKKRFLWAYCVLIGAGITLISGCSMLDSWVDPGGVGELDVGAEATIETVTGIASGIFGPPISFILEALGASAIAGLGGYAAWRKYKKSKDQK